MYEYIKLDKTGGTMPVYVIFVLGLSYDMGDILLKINISYKNINSYGNIIFLLHFLYNFQYILRNHIFFKYNKYISHRK